MKSPATHSSGMLVLIIGPSGVGKTALVSRIRLLHPEFAFARSATTRQRRQGEGNAMYHFVSDAEFDKLLSDQKFLEWATVHSSARYGTLVDDIVPTIKKGGIVIREVDVQGFESIRSHPLFRPPHATHTLLSIFVAPESREQLLVHIELRGPMGKEELRQRLISYEHEMEFARLCDATVVSREGKLDDVVSDIVRIIRSH